MAIAWGTVPDWIMAIAAAFGVIVGLRQLILIRREEHRSAQFERGKLLLEIDRDFEAADVAASRQKLLALRNRFEQEVAERTPTLTVDKQIGAVAQALSDYATAVWKQSRTYDGNPAADKDSASDEYKLMMRSALWCETVGHLCERNLLPIEDVLDLYDQFVINVIGNLAEHIRLRCENGPAKNPRYLENALKLYRAAVRYKAERETPLPNQPARSQVDWQN